MASFMKQDSDVFSEVLNESVVWKCKHSGVINEAFVYVEFGWKLELQHLIEKVVHTL